MSTLRTRPAEMDLLFAGNASLLRDDGTGAPYPRWHGQRSGLGPFDPDVSRIVDAEFRVIEVTPGPSRRSPLNRVADWLMNLLRPPT